MKIPICHIAKYNRIQGQVYYDTETNRFCDNMDNIKLNRELPIQDYITCIIDNSHRIITVIGKIKNKYAICFGDNMIHMVDKQFLLKYKLSNIKITSNKSIRCIDGKLEDLSSLFPDSNIKFINDASFINTSSLGIARKFTALYKNKLCIVKFSKTHTNEDLKNEIIYKNIADILKVPCCNVIQTIYSGKPCIVSFFEYNPSTDIFQSFKNYGMNISRLYEQLSKADKFTLDKMLILDYLMRQQDRHMSNLALINNKIYPLFDNGECLGLGSIGYFSENFRNYVQRLDKEYIHFLIKLDIRKVTQIKNVLKDKYKIFSDNAKELEYSEV